MRTACFTPQPQQYLRLWIILSAGVRSRGCGTGTRAPGVSRRGRDERQGGTAEENEEGGAEEEEEEDVAERPSWGISRDFHLETGDNMVRKKLRGPRSRHGTRSSMIGGWSFDFLISNGP